MHAITSNSMIDRSNIINTVNVQTITDNIDTRSSLLMFTSDLSIENKLHKIIQSSL